jgi:hypothetical protein
MPTTFPCPKCQNSITGPAIPGKAIRCSNCGTVAQIPAREQPAEEEPIELEQDVDGSYRRGAATGIENRPGTVCILIGTLLLMIGALATAFSFAMKTSTVTALGAVPDIALLYDRQSAILISLAAVGSGLFLLVHGWEMAKQWEMNRDDPKRPGGK